MGLIGRERELADLSRLHGRPRSPVLDTRAVLPALPGPERYAIDVGELALEAIEAVP
jgi:hypothetical protein